MLSYHRTTTSHDISFLVSIFLVLWVICMTHSTKNVTSIRPIATRNLPFFTHHLWPKFSEIRRRPNRKTRVPPLLLIFSTFQCKICTHRRLVTHLGGLSEPGEMFPNELSPNVVTASEFTGGEVDTASVPAETRCRMISTYRYVEVNMEDNCVKFL